MASGRSIFHLIRTGHYESFPTWQVLSPSCTIQSIWVFSRSVRVASAWVTHKMEQDITYSSARCTSIIVSSTIVLSKSFKFRADMLSLARMRNAIRSKIRARYMFYSEPFGYPAYMCVVYTHPTLPRGKYPWPHDAQKLTPSGRLKKKMERQCRVRYTYDVILIIANCPVTARFVSSPLPTSNMNWTWAGRHCFVKPACVRKSSFHDFLHKLNRCLSKMLSAWKWRWSSCFRHTVYNADAIHAFAQSIEQALIHTGTFATIHWKSTFLTSEFLQTCNGSRIVSLLPNGVPKSKYHGSSVSNVHMCTFRYFHSHFTSQSISLSCMQGFFWRFSTDMTVRACGRWITWKRHT